MAASSASSAAPVSKGDTILQSIANRMLNMDQQEEESEQKSRWAFDSTEVTWLCSSIRFNAGYIMPQEHSRYMINIKIHGLFHISTRIRTGYVISVLASLVLI